MPLKNKKTKGRTKSDEKLAFTIFTLVITLVSFIFGFVLSDLMREDMIITVPNMTLLIEYDLKADDFCKKDGFSFGFLHIDRFKQDVFVRCVDKPTERGSLNEEFTLEEMLGI